MGHRTGSGWKALGIAALAILLPDMGLTARIMAEALVYPLFLLTAMLMFRALEGGKNLGHAALTALCAALLANAKAGMAALAVVFAGVLLFAAAKDRPKKLAGYALMYIGVYAALTAVAHFAIGMLPCVDYARSTIYETQAQAPTWTHLSQTLPGLLLYAFFIPVAFGIFPLLLPACNLKRFEPAVRRQAALALIALAAVAAGACYLFFDTETVGSFYAGRIHIRYVFMFLPLFLAFAAAPALEGVKPNGKLIAALGFLLAMASTVGFSALLSNRRYPVDAISLSWIMWDNSALEMNKLSQIAAIEFSVAMLWLLFRRGWGKTAKTAMAICLVAGLVAANAFGYDLNRWNDSEALSSDSAQAARMLDGKTTLLAPDSGFYFDNTLSVLDVSMKQAPYEMLLEDLCENLGPYGELIPAQPPKYWTEQPAGKFPEPPAVAMDASAFYRVVLAQGAAVKFTDHTVYGIVTPANNRRLFHSALTGVDAQGSPKAGAALYIFDENLLKQGKVTVYLQVQADNASSLELSCGSESQAFDAGTGANWITRTFGVPIGATRLVVSIRAVSGAPKVITYKVG